MEDSMEMIVFDIINNGGTAKGLIYEAIESAEAGDFEQAEKLLAEADEYLVDAHKVQTDLIHDEANGIHHDIGVLFVHAQDHLMTCLEVRSLAENLIRMNKRLYALENKE